MDDDTEWPEWAWHLHVVGQNGEGQPAADVSSDQMPKQAISDFSIAEKSLVLGYSFTWEGNAVSAVITLTPAPEGVTKAQIDFAGGAYVMTGTATKKDK